MRSSPSSRAMSSTHSLTGSLCLNEGTRHADREAGIFPVERPLPARDSLALDLGCAADPDAAPRC